MITDTHAHLDVKQFKPDFDAVIKRAREAGVGIIINIGPSINSSKAALQITDSKIKMYSSIGLHPEYVPLVDPDKSIPLKIKALEKIYLANPQKVVGVGECGLDYFKRDGQITGEEIIAQKALFQAQINLAKKLNLPLIIHCRDAWEDIFDFDFSGVTAILHSFTGSKEIAQKALDLGFYLSFSCIITYPKNEALREIIKSIPLEKVLTETDCPFLPPQTQRGQRNEPANVSEVVKTIAEIKDLTFDQVAEITLNNAKTLFNLP
ncbi:MAG: TatD family hydrolase [Candidatus Daviesbacteria bacterium]|nr:TatD family hydrolase [Candidatus Daviesbacteria bacterium]